MGVADLAPGQAPATQLSKRRPLDKRVVDQPHGWLTFPPGRGTGTRPDRGSSVPTAPVQQNDLLDDNGSAAAAGGGLTPRSGHIYRSDTSDRYIRPHHGLVGGRARARACCAWTPQRGADVGLRAEKAARRQARRLLAGQLRIPVPMPQAAAGGRRARGRGDPFHVAQETRLPADRPWRAALPGAARIGRPARPRAGPVLPAAGLLPVPAAGDPARPARAAPQVPAGAPCPPARLAARRPRAAGRLHPGADGPRAGRARARDRLARPADRGGARRSLRRPPRRVVPLHPPPGRHRAGGTWASSPEPNPPARPPPARPSRPGRAEPVEE